MSRTSGADHYASAKIEAVEVIEGFGLDWHLGNAVKYILRCGRKGPVNLEIEKAIDFLWRKRYGTWATLPERTPEKGNG